MIPTLRGNKGKKFFLWGNFGGKISEKNLKLNTNLEILDFCAFFLPPNNEKKISP